MIQKTGIAAIDEVLHQMDKAVGRDEFEDASGLLPPVTRNYIDELIAQYDSHGYTNYYLVTSLSRQSTKQAMPLFERAIKDKHPDIREVTALLQASL
tara:strand:+ start:7528 stop:7818 length:291 start_codon:yes stop_codon:yes gene_type:complete